MRYYFQYAQRVFIDPGYPPLFYSAFADVKPSQNLSAVCAIGEGVAGLILQQNYRCRKLVRPYQDGVDIIMTDNKFTYLVEAKGSAAKNSNDLRQKLDKEYLVEIVTETLSSYGIDNRKVKGILIGVYLENESKYNCYVTEINIDNNVSGTFNNKVDINNQEFTVYQQTETLIKQICSSDFLDKLSKEENSSDLATNLEELVLISIRNSVKNHTENINLNELTNQVISEVLNLLETEIDKLSHKEYKDKISIIKTYLEKIKKQLKDIYNKKDRQPKKDSSIYNDLKELKLTKFLSRQVEEDIQQELQEVIKNNDLLKIQKKLIDQGIVLKLTKIEFNSYTEGLLIYPGFEDIRKHYVITLNNLPEKFHTIEIFDEEIKNFPIEIYYGETAEIHYREKYDYIFIIDDDGSIYVNTQNLPTDSFKTAKDLLIQLAMALYK